MNIEKLKKQKQWVNWIGEKNATGVTKKPVSYTGKSTGTTKEFKHTWGTFEEVYNNRLENHNLGIGLVLANGICGIDIDHRDLEDPVVVDILNIMQTYSEISPSGNGIHLLFMVDLNRLPKDLKEKYYLKNPHNKIECYISGLTNRYFTFTEQRINGNDIMKRTDELVIFLDKYMKRKSTIIKNTEAENLEEVSNRIINIINKSKQSNKFKMLYYEGNTKEYGGDDSAADMALCSILAFYCGEDFDLIDYLFSKSKLYRDKWDRIDYKANTIIKSIKLQNGEFYKNGINFRLIDTLRKLKVEKKYSYNDVGMSKLFAKIFEKQLRYNATARQWYYFNGKVWQIDFDGVITAQKMKELSIALTTYATQIKDKSIKENFLKYVKTLGTFKARDTIIKDSKNEMCVYQHDFDKNVDLFNCQNGTLNLVTFEFCSHNAEDLLSKISNVVYNPEAEAVRFKKFINEIMIKNENKIIYLQKALGYSLTTDVSQETSFILYGSTTRNGKGTLTNTIVHMFGDYATTALPETIAKKKFKDSSRATGDIARLDGCRFLNMSEPENHMYIDASIFKSLTGRDKITARHLHQREFEFYPVFKLFINCNYLPKIDDNTVFRSRRVNVITFDRHFFNFEEDKHLKNKLIETNELSGIFNWCLDGLKAYREAGLIPPKEVVEATQKYEISNDKFSAFFEEELIESDKNTSLNDVYRRYEEWCCNKNMTPLYKDKVKEKLIQRGVFKERGTVNKRTTYNIVYHYELRNKN